MLPEKFKAIEEKYHNVNVTVKTIFLCLCFFLLFAAGFTYIPRAVTTIGHMISERRLPIYCVKTEKPQIALSFDAAWGNEDTANILNILAKHNVRVTFFMTGEWMQKYPEDVKAIAAAGHDLGNHSQSHKQMSKLSKAQCVEELTVPHEYIKELTGVNMCLFRPPYGDYNDTLINAAESCGYYTIQWDVDSLDWKDYGTASIIKTVTEHKHLGNGSIILMHNGAKYTPDALDSIITTLKEKGYEFVPISELILKQSYQIDHEGRQYSDAPAQAITPTPSAPADNVGKRKAG